MKNSLPVTLTTPEAESIIKEYSVFLEGILTSAGIDFVTTERLAEAVSEGSLSMETIAEIRQKKDVLKELKNNYHNVDIRRKAYPVYISFHNCIEFLPLKLKHKKYSGPSLQWKRKEKIDREELQKYGKEALQAERNKVAGLLYACLDSLEKVDSVYRIRFREVLQGAKNAHSVISAIAEEIERGDAETIDDTPYLPNL